MYSLASAGSTPRHLSMQPLSTAGSLRSGQDPAELDTPEPIPARWQESLANVAEAQALVQKLATALDDALYLDVQDWKRAAPASQQHEEKGVRM